MLALNIFQLIAHRSEKILIGIEDSTIRGEFDNGLGFIQGFDDGFLFVCFCLMMMMLAIKI